MATRRPLDEAWAHQRQRLTRHTRGREAVSCQKQTPNSGSNCPTIFAPASPLRWISRCSFSTRPAACRARRGSGFSKHRRIGRDVFGCVRCLAERPSDHAGERVRREKAGCTSRRFRKLDVTSQNFPATPQATRSSRFPPDVSAKWSVVLPFPRCHPSRVAASGSSLRGR